MKSRIVIVTLLMALLSLPMSASAWWWNKERETLVDVAVATSEATGDFNILLDLVVADKKIFRRLDGWRHTTVFAPTDQAFVDLLNVVAGEPFCYSGLDEIPGWYVRDVLNYHLAGGFQDSGEVFFGENNRTRMLFGGYLFANAEDLSLTDNAVLAGSGLAPAGIVAEVPLLGGGTVQGFDIAADNGIIHAIDRVVLPYLPPSNCE